MPVSVPNFVFFRGRVVPYADVKFGVLTHALNYGTASLRACYAWM